jgi:HlyD family secretion protein
MTRVTASLHLRRSPIVTPLARRARSFLVLVPLALAACKKEESQAAAVETVAVSRQDIVVDVEATGVLSPINAVEVRSKASGQIVNMPVQTGTEVKPGDLLVHIDPRDATTRYEQASAQLRAARTSLEVTRSQYERAQALSKQGVITAPELETATTAYANAQSQVATAQASVETARVALEDVTIRAPSAGVVIARNVAPGQVIASATNSASGGTVLLTLANLDAVYDSTLVSESDIGKVKPGQQVTVTVDAYPNRVFRGVVEKIEPRATVQQSVTMFPVLVRLDNSERLLMPGMNSDVTVLVQREQQALTVPNDALATPRDAGTAATALGLDAEQVRTALASAGNRGAPGTNPGDTGLSRTVSSSAGTVANGNGANGAASGARGARGDSARRGGRTAGANGAAGGTQGNGAWRGGQGGGMGAGRGGAGRTQRGVVFVKKGESYEPRVVTLGIGNYDVTQVLSGVEEGEQVALISSAVLQQTRTERNERIRSRSQLPGMGGGTSTGTSTGRGGAGGGGAPGGGGGPGGGGRGPGGGN